MRFYVSIIQALQVLRIMLSAFMLLPNHCTSFFSISFRKRCIFCEISVPAIDILDKRFVNLFDCGFLPFVFTPLCVYFGEEYNFGQRILSMTSNVMKNSLPKMRRKMIQFCKDYNTFNCIFSKLVRMIWAHM